MNYKSSKFNINRFYTQHTSATVNKKNSNNNNFAKNVTNVVFTITDQMALLNWFQCDFKLYTNLSTYVYLLK